MIPLLSRAPRKRYSAGFLRALAETQDRHFAGLHEGLIGHVNDWDSKTTNRSFYAVAGSHRYQDGRKPTSHCTTFQTKAAALAFAQRWRLNCPADEIRLLVCDAAWRVFVPDTKTDRVAVDKITTPHKERTT